MKWFVTTAILAATVLAGQPAQAAPRAQLCAPTASNTSSAGVVTFTVSFACPIAEVRFVSKLIPGAGVTCTPDTTIDVDVDQAGKKAELSFFLEQECTGAGTVTADSQLTFLKKNGTVRQESASSSTFAAATVIEVTGGGELDLPYGSLEAHGFTSDGTGAGAGASGLLKK